MHIIPERSTDLVTNDSNVCENELQFVEERQAAMRNISEVKGTDPLCKSPSVRHDITFITVHGTEQICYSLEVSYEKLREEAN